METKQEELVKRFLGEHLELLKKWDIKHNIKVTIPKIQISQIKVLYTDNDYIMDFNQYSEKEEYRMPEVSIKELQEEVEEQQDDALKENLKRVIEIMAKDKEENKKIEEVEENQKEGTKQEIVEKPKKKGWFIK